MDQQRSAIVKHWTMSNVPSVHLWPFAHTLRLYHHAPINRLINYRAYDAARRRHDTNVGHTAVSSATSAVADFDVGSDAVYRRSPCCVARPAQGLSPVATSEVQGRLDRDGRVRKSSSCEALAISGSARVRESSSCEALAISGSATWLWSHFYGFVHWRGDCQQVLCWQGRQGTCIYRQRAAANIHSRSTWAITA